ncbi:MAG: MMPL family transporter [Candidatus Omnitrophica bacterium]|nr:MMPL family transporter [Candidatus Omnitrophota bacterium]
MFRKIIHLSIKKPKTVFAICFIVVVLAAFQFPRIKVDTDPENMLSKDEFVRVFDHDVKKEFALYDFIVLGIVNNETERGVFTKDSLNRIFAITEKIKDIEGVITREIIAPSTKDNIRQGGLGVVVFEWLMKSPIETEAEAVFLRDEAMDNPMFKGSMVSDSGKALCLYIPIEKKNISYRVATQIRKIVSDLGSGEKYYITGLPVAEDTFGFEMFKQMAISAPLAGLIIFLLMFFFFRNIRMIIPPMILAVITIIVTMGLLIGFGFPVHIMSSMIPIFLMPIAVLDSVHILSEFFDKYPRYKDKKKTITHVIEELFTPMLFTSLTSAVGFFSLSFSPIPPVQAFGVFVALGIMVAWLLTITFIPAYVSVIKEDSLKDFGHILSEEAAHSGLLDKSLRLIHRFTLKHFKAIIGFSGLLIVISIYGISHIQVNDNPVKWFNKNHEIRIADKILNEHFAGTYTAYLVIKNQSKTEEIFKEPKMLAFIEGLENYLIEKGNVGKITSLADVVKKVHYELFDGDKTYNIIPETKKAVSQCLISYENSHKPDDLWHMVTPDYSKLNVWLQLKSGDNKDTDKVLRQVDAYFSANPPPYKVDYNWAGLTYINVVWQNKMVKGMLVNFLGSFFIVFFMMTFLFRSPLRGLISMVPLTLTILFIYGLLGFIGKDYDMPVAVLSALTLGLSIDFAIHFIQRAREIYDTSPNWPKTSEEMFKGPARAITRNAFVVAIGFLPLLAAPLVPYRTVGFFMFTIMLVSSIATLFILPALITAFPQAIFGKEEKKMVCNCKYCVIISFVVSLSIVYLSRSYTEYGLGITSLVAVLVVTIASGICSKIAKHKFCLVEKKET